MDPFTTLSLESLLHLAHFAVHDDGWSEVKSPVEGLSVWKRRQSSRTVLLRTCYEQAMTPDHAVDLFRPEVFFHTSKREYDPEVLDCGIEKLLAPGDALGFTRLRAPLLTCLL